MIQAGNTIAQWEKVRLHNIDALRGVAAFLVLSQHLLTTAVETYLPNTWADRFVTSVCADYFDLGRFGVIAFFCVSGFVIPFSFASETPVRRFVLSRFFRLYPAYWVSLLAAVLLHIFVLAPPLSTKPILANVTMLQTWLGSPDALGVYWTLAIEQIFYGICVIAFVARRLHSPGYAALGSVGFALLGLGCAFLHAATHRSLPTALPLALSVMHIGMLSRMAMIERSAGADMLLRPIVTASLVLILAACYLNYPAVAGGDKSSRVAQMVSYAAAIPTFFLFACRPHGTFGRLPLLGAISYSLYLIHWPVQRFLLALLGPSSRGLPIYLIGGTLLPIVLAAALFRWVEEPSIVLGRSLGGRRRLREAARAGA